MVSHFQGKTAVDHLKEARLKGFWAIRGPAGLESAGWLSAGIDASRDVAVLLVIFCVLCQGLGVSIINTISSMILFTIGLLVWKSGRSGLLAWQRIERFHRLVDEEKWAIEHHPKDERRELKELYEAKGLSGKLLDDTVEVLMSDDTRLLLVMLEEEFGLSMESCDHPLQQAAGAFLGVIGAFAACFAGFYFFSLLGLMCASGVIILLTAYFTAKREKNRLTNILVWTIATVALSIGLIYIIASLLRF